MDEIKSLKILPKNLFLELLDKPFQQTSKELLQYSFKMFEFHSEKITVS